MDDDISLNIREHQEAEAQRQFLDDWLVIQQQCPTFLANVQGMAVDLEQQGYQGLFRSQTEKDEIKARSLVVAGRALAQLFHSKEVIEQQLDANDFDNGQAH